MKQKTICMVCGKVGSQSGKPLIENGKELPSHVTCKDDFCQWGLVELMAGEEPFKYKKEMFEINIEAEK